MIRISPVRVISDSGEQLGVLTIEEALAAAEERGLDLVEVAPTARPPVVKIMDYGKYKFEEAKAARAAKKKQHVIDIKEVKFRPGIDDHDFDFKTRHMREFLQGGRQGESDDDVSRPADGPDRSRQGGARSGGYRAGRHRKDRIRRPARRAQHDHGDRAQVSGRSLEEIAMPKMKTKRAAMKRFTVTGSGKLKRGRANKRHILTKKTRKRKNQLGKAALVSSADFRRVNRLLQA